MTTISDPVVKSREEFVKDSGSYLHDTKPVDEVDRNSTIVDHTTKEPDLVALRSWLDTVPSGLLKLRNLTLEEAEALAVELQRAGHKVRYDWRRSDQTAVFRMTTVLHNAPASWLTLCVPKLESAVQGSARCGKPFLLLHGDGRVDYGDLAHTLQPDNRIDVNVHFGHGHEQQTYCVPEPRIILETAYSQTVYDAQQKAWEYLWAGDAHTHAVIVVDLSYPATLKKDFVAKIAIWSRSETGNTDEDYPFEASERYEHDLGPMLEDEQGVESPGVSDRLSAVGSATLTQASEGITMVEITPEEVVRSDSGGVMRKIETLGYTVVLDEVKGPNPSMPSPDGFELVLDTFHFLRRCPQHPDDIPKPSELVLPLAPLQHHIIEALACHRAGQLRRKRKAEETNEDVTQSLPQQAEGPTTMRRTTPPILQDWKLRKKNRRV